MLTDIYGNQYTYEELTNLNENFYNNLNKYRMLLKKKGIKFVKSRKWNHYQYVMPSGLTFDTFHNLFCGKESIKDINFIFELHNNDKEIDSIRKALFSEGKILKKFFCMPSIEALKFPSGFIHSC